MCTLCRLLLMPIGKNIGNASLHCDSYLNADKKSNILLGIVFKHFRVGENKNTTRGFHVFKHIKYIQKYAF